MFREEAGFDEGVFIEVEHGRGAGLIIDRPVKAITLSYICIILYSYSFSPTNFIIFAIDENGPAKGSDSISSAWQRERFESTCVAPRGPEEGGGGEEQVALYAAACGCDTLSACGVLSVRQCVDRRLDSLNLNQ